MFYDGILSAIITKNDSNHDIIDSALNYLKLNKKTNAKVITDIPYQIFKNLDFLSNVNDYVVINVKASINEFKRELDLNYIKDVINKHRLKFYGSRLTTDSMQVFISTCDKKTIYNLYVDLKEIDVLSISDKLIIYEASDIFTTDLINNNYLSRFIIINSGNSYSLDSFSAYLGDISNINSCKKEFLKLYSDINIRYNFYADIINYLTNINNVSLTNATLQILPGYFKNAFNDYYERIYTTIEGPLYLLSTDGLTLNVCLSKDSSFDCYIGYDANNIYITNQNINIFNVNKFYSIKDYLEINLESKEVKKIEDIINNLPKKNNELFIVNDNESNYESLFELNEDLIEICKDNIQYKTFLNGIYPSVRKTKVDLFYTNRYLTKSIYVKKVILSLSEYEYILKLENDFKICYLKNSNLDNLVKEEVDFIIITDEEFDIYYDQIIENAKKVCFIIISEKYKFEDFAYYLSCGVSLIYPYKAYMMLKGFEEKKIIKEYSINIYVRYLKNNLSKLMLSYGMHYVRSFIASNVFDEVIDKRLDKMMLINLEEALKSNSYDKYKVYSSYFKNSFKYKKEIKTSEACDKAYIKSLFRCILPVSSEVRKYLNEAFNMNITTLDKRFIQDSFSDEIFINFIDDSTNYSLTDYNMFKNHKIIPNTLFVGVKYYYDIYSFKDLKALVLELKGINKKCKVILKITNIENIVDYVTSGVDELIIDDIKLLKEANDLLVEANLRNNILLSLEYDYMNAYDIIKAAINGSNRFYFKKSILFTLGCVGFNKCYKCPNGLFGNLKYYGNGMYLTRFLDFISYEAHVISSLIGFNNFSDSYTNYLDLNNNINSIILKNASSGITDMSCNALLEDNICSSINVDKNIFVLINGNVGYNFGSYLKKEINLSLNGTAQKYLGKCLNGGTIYVFNNAINEINDENNYLVGKCALLKANSGKVFIDGFASSFFALANNGCDALVLGMDDYGCSYMTNGRVICLGEVGNHFAYNMTGGIAYIYDEFKNLSSRIDTNFVDITKIDGEDILFISSMLEAFKDRANSKKCKALSKYINPELFIKVVPKNYGIMMKNIKIKEKSGLSFNDAVKEVMEIAKSNG